MAHDRDDFTESTKRLLANRVCGRCSNPDCRKPTMGANTDPNKTINIGVAAHICAAAPGGPRYEATMAENERKSSQNGIWLCQSCAKLIDSDPNKYSKDLLYAWKKLAETTSTLELEHPMGISNINSVQHNADIHSNRWFEPSEKNSHFSWWHSEIDKFCTVTGGSVILISGYTGVGIDMFVQNVIRRNLKTGNKVIYFNLKESSTTIVNSMIAAESHVKTNCLRTGTLSSDEWNRIAEAANELGKKPFILEPYNSNEPSLMAYFLSAISDGNSDIVVLDDLDGLCIDNATSLNSFMYQLRNAAIQSGTLIFILADFNEVPKRMDKRPMLTDAPIDKLVKFFDVVLFLYHNENEYLSSVSESRILELIVAKNYSPTQSGLFYIAQHSDYSKIVECEQPEVRKDFLNKYPGLVAGAKALADCLEKL